MLCCRHNCHCLNYRLRCLFLVIIILSIFLYFKFYHLIENLQTLKSSKSKFHICQKYQSEKPPKCSKYDLMGRLPVYPKQLENQYEPRRFLIEQNFSCDEDVLAIAIILSRIDNFDRRSLVSIFSKCFIYLFFLCKFLLIFIISFKLKFLKSKRKNLTNIMNVRIH